MPSWEANRAARIMRSGIIGEGVLRGARGAQHRGVQVPDPAERVHQFQGGQPQRHGVDGEVPAQQVVGQ